MVRELLGDRYRYVSFDDTDVLDAAKSDPGLFFRDNRPPIILDEIQYAPELFSRIKLIVDQSPEKGRFVLTGSQTYHLMGNEDFSYIEESLRSPCTQEIAVFRAFADIVAKADEEVVVIDTAPTGHTLLLLESTQNYDEQMESTGGEVPESVRELLPRLHAMRSIDKGAHVGVFSVSIGGHLVTVRGRISIIVRTIKFSKSNCAKNLLSEQ